ncbi:Glycolipid transfer protein superfamily [Arabidopsis thaliana x Arabidopsis arenosa]|uniref:Glycolipid transfer protein superfamily n=1 Tax=Arabidopsis thaliana x Arabidopsis arenosa TaxID=1240361 RepID=A0A8T2AB07_9BRAS|nr:Glycolipid transfer protein superfamily [Arabidopsis thaliana x Arabidopsis arenosa]
MADSNADKPLRKISTAFKELAVIVNSPSPEVPVAQFSHACSLVSPLFGCLGIAFKFAEMDYVAKVDDLVRASSSISTLVVMMEKDIEADCVRKAGSHTRNLLRVKRGLDMVKVLFEQIIASEGDNSLKDPATKSYAQVFAPHHGWAIRKAVSLGMYALPTRAHLLNMLKEDEAAAKIHMQSYVNSSAPLITYLDNLFLSKQLGIDW